MVKTVATCIVTILVCLCCSPVRAQDTDAHADFAIAYQLMLPREGGYVNSKKLKGGETYRGINRRSHPRWEGWKTLDKHKMKYDEVLDELEGAVESFYKEHYWDVIRGDEITNQKTANDFFYLAVKRGTDQAIQIKARSVGMPPTTEMNDALMARINSHHVAHKVSHKPTHHRAHTHHTSHRRAHHKSKKK